jgi:hypothetical protein
MREGVMALTEFSDFDNDPEKLKAFLPPGQTETTLRQCIQMCWMSLPANRRNIDEVEREVRRIMDRIFKNLREDERSISGE